MSKVYKPRRQKWFAWQKSNGVVSDPRSGVENGGETRVD